MKKWSTTMLELSVPVRCYPKWCEGLSINRRPNTLISNLTNVKTTVFWSGTAGAGHQVPDPDASAHKLLFGCGAELQQEILTRFGKADRLHGYANFADPALTGSRLGYGTH